MLRSVSRTKHTIEGLDSSKIHLPAKMLAVDLPEVGYVKCILFTRLACVNVNVSNTLLQNFLDQALRGKARCNGFVITMMIVN